MPCVLLTLASEEVKGEAFLPERQVPVNCFRVVCFFSTKKKKETQEKQAAQRSCSDSFFLMGELACAQRANYTVYQYVFTF